jgi:predicted phosphodiesterase
VIKIGLVSDLHTEFWRPSDQQRISTMIQQRLADADLLLLPGDLGIGMAGIKLVKTMFPERPVFVVAGNHEFYNGDYDVVMADLQSMIGNVKFLHKSVAQIEIAGVSLRIIGTTLWTDFNLHGTVPLALLDAHGINDFRSIRYQGRILRPEDTLRWHQEQRTSVLQMLDTPFDGITILMTHHAPVSFAISPHYVGDSLSPCFASRMDDLLVRDDLPLVVWGHTHHCIDRTIGNTRFVSNQTGYPGWSQGSVLATETGEFGQIIELA